MSRGDKIQIVRKTVVAGSVAANRDTVMAYAPIPPGGKVLSITGELHVLGSETQLHTKYRCYGVSGELVPITDPDDASLNLDALWDNMVIKPKLVTEAAATTTYDWDFDSTSADADVEIAKMDLTSLSGMANPNKTLLAPHMEFLSLAKGPQVGWTTGSPGSYHPVSFKRFRMRPGVVADKIPHYALLAISSPVVTGNEETVHNVISNAGDWGLLSNLKSVMQDFWRINAGLVEADAESPYAQASKAVQDLVAPPLLQPTTDLLFTATWSFLCAATWLLEFDADMVPKVLRADAG